MVQDMHNPEYYFEKYEVENEETKEKRIKCGKYRDTTDLSVRICMLYIVVSLLIYSIVHYI